MKRQQIFNFDIYGHKHHHKVKNQHVPVVGNDDEMFRTAGYDLLLRQAAAVGETEGMKQWSLGSGRPLGPNVINM